MRWLVQGQTFHMDLGLSVGIWKIQVKSNGQALKWVLWYLRGTSDYCITYNSGCESVFGYVDSDFAGDLDRRRSTSGMSLILQVELLVGCQSYITLLLYPLHKHNA
jgi:hypothetical protein